MPERGHQTASPSPKGAGHSLPGHLARTEDVPHCLLHRPNLLYRNWRIYWNWWLGGAAVDIVLLLPLLLVLRRQFVAYWKQEGGWHVEGGEARQQWTERDKATELAPWAGRQRRISLPRAITGPVLRGAHPQKETHTQTLAHTGTGETELRRSPGTADSRAAAPDSGVTEFHTRRRHTAQKTIHTPCGTN